MATERFAERTIRHLARQGYQPQKIRRLARAMGIADDESAGGAGGEATTPNSASRATDSALT